MIISSYELDKDNFDCMLKLLEYMIYSGKLVTKDSISVTLNLAWECD